MKNVKKQIEELKNSASKLQETDNTKIYNGIISILESLSAKVEEALVNDAVLAENFRYMDEDISDIQDEIFEEVSIEDLEEMEEEYKEIICNHCGKSIYLEESVLKNNQIIKCPYCSKDLRA